MMDTVLNLGLNDKTVEGLAARTKNERFAWDCYRRFITIFGDVVLAIDRQRLRRAAGRREDARGRQDGCRPPGRGAPGAGRGIQEGRAGQDRPGVPAGSTRAAPAGHQRGLRVLVGQEGGGLPPHPPAARRLGHRGDRDGDGLRQPRRRPRAPGSCFSRDPSTGERRFFGEFLVNAQGEDVVAGIRTPEPLDALKQRMPPVYAELIGDQGRLERHYRDMQDIEFTVQEGRLYILQTRSGKRTGGGRGAHRGGDGAGAAHRPAHRARCAWSRASLHQLLVKTVDPAARYTVDRHAACPPPRRPRWARSCSTRRRRWRWRSGKRRSSWCAPRPRRRTSPACTRPRGSLTSRGGLTSHAAVVARGLGQVLRGGRGRRGGGRGGPSLPGRPRGRARGAGDHAQRRHRRGDRGRPAAGRPQALRRVPGAPGLGPGPRHHHGARQRRHARRRGARPASSAPRASASCAPSTCSSATTASPIVREMIMAGDDQARQKAVDQLLPFQREDFIGIFRAMDGLAGDDPAARPAAPRVPAPSTRRCSRSTPGSTRAASTRSGTPELGAIKARLEALREANPMLGPPRLPARHHVPRDLRHAGARHHGGGLRGGRARACRSSPRS